MTPSMSAVNSELTAEQREILSKIAQLAPEQSATGLFSIDHSLKRRGGKWCVVRYYTAGTEETIGEFDSLTDALRRAPKPFSYVVEDDGKTSNAVTADG
jgi:hypothetical protein